MISRVTLYSLLLCLLLGAGLTEWRLTHPDDCDRYLAGDKKLPASRYVQSGGHMIAVSCNQWLLRQPERIQILWGVDLVIAAIFTVNAAGDTQDWFARRRQPRAPSHP